MKQRCDVKLSACTCVGWCVGFGNESECVPSKRPRSHSMIRSKKNISFYKLFKWYTYIGILFINCAMRLLVFISFCFNLINYPLYLGWGGLSIQYRFEYFFTLQIRYEIVFSLYSELDMICLPANVPGDLIF